MTNQPISEADLSALYDVVFETIQRQLKQTTETIERGAKANPRAREATKNEAIAAMRKVIDRQEKSESGRRVDR